MITRQPNPFGSWKLFLVAGAIVAALPMLALAQDGSSAGAEAAANAAQPAADAPTMAFHDRLLVPINDMIREQIFFFRYDSATGSPLPESAVTPWHLWFWPVVWGLAIIIATQLVGLILDKLIYAWLKRFAARTKSTRDDELIDAVRLPTIRFVYLTGFAVVSYIWAWRFHEGDPSTVFYRVLVTAYFVALWLLAGLFLFKIANFFSGLLADFATSTKTNFDNHLVHPISKTMHAAVVIFTAIMVLQTIGGDITGILAGLGLGGLAFALAGQETVRNLFGSVMIFADRPFQIGDTITVGGITGTVETIGFRSTRVRTFDKTEITVPNKEFTDSRVENLSRRTFRRFKTTFGATYATTREQMQGLVNAIRHLLAQRPDVVTDSVTVYFTAFNASSLDIMVSCNIGELNYAKYLAAVQDINFGIWELYDEYGVEMPFNTQTIHNKYDTDWATVLAQGLELFEQRRSKNPAAHHLPPTIDAPAPSVMPDTPATQSTVTEVELESPKPVVAADEKPQLPAKSKPKAKKKSKAKKKGKTKRANEKKGEAAAQAAESADGKPSDLAQSDIDTTGDDE